MYLRVFTARWHDLIFPLQQAYKTAITTTLSFPACGAKRLRGYLSCPEPASSKTWLELGPPTPNSPLLTPPQVEASANSALRLKLERPRRPHFRISGLETRPVSAGHNSLGLIDCVGPWTTSPREPRGKPSGDWLKWIRQYGATCSYRPIIGRKGQGLPRRG